MSSNTHRFNFFRIGANLITSLSQIIVPLLPSLGYGSFVGQQSAAQDIPIVPAGYAFSIWSIIFLLSLVYGIVQAFPVYRHHPVFTRIGWYTAGAFFSNTLWMIVTQFSSITWPTAIIICAILAFALRAMFLLTGNKKHDRPYTIAYATVSLLAGWVSAATVLNIATVLTIESTTIGASIILATALAVSSIIYKTHGNMVYASAVIWALVGIIVRQYTDVQHMNILLATITGILLILGVIWYSRRSHT